MEQLATGRVLIVDDETFYIDVLVELLGEHYQVSVAKSGEQAMKRINDGFRPDLILLDVLMKGMDGYQVCAQLKATPALADIPVIFLTVKSDVDSEMHGFELGASDYIVKPFSPPIVRARVSTHIALAKSRQALKAKNILLEERVQERTEEIARTQDVAIYCMASLAETRDNETGKHIRRTQHYVKSLAEALVDHPRFQQQLNEEYIDLLFKSAPLHDIGKVGVPDAVLLKPGKLDAAEWEEMKKHAEYGKEALENAESEYGSSDFLCVAKEIAYGHHEKWDGSGYPQGISEEQIPVSARLMAVADCYDALISRRVYKPPFTHEQAAQIILDGRGKHFDPAVVDVFEAIQDRFIEIAKEYADDDYE
ncbi:HD domain-containing phosphohydrolase [Corallincola platygyrae]|uniref:HD domain-containing phosphohydrolase n=1 Tax=Corallincola platygyrae TaxID=1193278 RepID=A0ABW4XP88_9GAMM